MVSNATQKNLPIVVVVIGLLVLIGMNFYKTVPPGRIGVATLFGNVQAEGYSQGLHIPVNPLYKWVMFDQLQSLEALKAISSDRASKVYFMDGSSPNPLPLLHMGDTVRSGS
jgi:regulator of protease activity HflC (stomatin/prohibitin superfamily)